MERRRIRLAPPGFLFFGVIAGRAELLEATKERIVRRYGELDPEGESADFPFPETATYRPQMGTGLSRRFFVLARRVPQDVLARVKHESIRIEDEIRAEWRAATGLERPVNIDPGLINDCRIILATTKDYSHRIYRRDGIWEEVTLVWRGGGWVSEPWTYRDFQNPAYHAFFTPFRERIIAPRRERDRRRASEP